MSNKEKVYLAGGMKSGWQDRIINKFENKFIFFNPCDHCLSVSKQYTTWDLHFLKKSDLVFAYLEKDNPSGIGLTLEVGYAKALNKTVILIDERSKIDEDFAIKFKIVRDSASIVFDDLESGLNFLDRFSIYST